MSPWPRVGLSLAIVAGFSIAVIEFLQATAIYKAWKWQIGGGVATAGVVLFFIGHVVNAYARRSRNARIKLDRQAVADFDGPFLLVDLTFWGIALVFCSVSMVFITPTYGHSPSHAGAVPTLAKIPRSASTSPNKLPAGESGHFPSGVLQGITYRATDPAVLIDGKTLFIGDRITGARLVKITRTTATFELDGQFKVLVIEK